MDPLKTPLTPQAPRSESTPIPGQPLQSQGMPTGQDPAMMPGQEFASPEERAQLVQLLEATKEKMAGLKTAEFTGANSRDAAKLDALRELFSMMQSAGVDLTSTESVNAFLEKIKAANPNMAQDFEEALEQLLGDDSMVNTETPTNETLQTDLRGSNGQPQGMA
jgi:hypothetical protein